MKKRLLIVVDYQNDFVDGALGFEKAKELEPYFDINQLKISFELKWTYEIDEDYEW